MDWGYDYEEVDGCDDFCNPDIEREEEQEELILN